ncbi:murein transglycosylase [Vibrio sp.]|nr:murein transglycosylase [Vibrio sp.]
MLQQFFPRKQLISKITLVLSSFFTPLTAAVSIEQIQEKRALYDQAQKLLDRKQISRYLNMRELIEDYSLTPYLDYRVMLSKLHHLSPNEVNLFIEKHQEYPFSQSIRAPYISSLVTRKNWKALIEFQPNEPNGESYQCHYYLAHYKIRNESIAFEGAKKLWLSGQSVSAACDPLFKEWAKVGGKTDDLILERILLAYQERSYSLANYLAKQLKGHVEQQQAKQMRSLFVHKKEILDYAEKNQSSLFSQQVSIVAFKKLVRRDVKTSQEILDNLITIYQITPEQSQEMKEQVAIRLFNTKHTHLDNWRDETILTSDNVKLIERRIRLAIQDADWKGVSQWISLLPGEAQRSLRWQFWAGRADILQGNPQLGTEKLKGLLGQRNFYSVAASRELGVPVYFPTSTLELNQTDVQSYSESLTRIQELLNRNKVSVAKQEWRWLLSQVPQNEKEMLTAYASEHQWHHFAVKGSIAAKMWDNLQLRFPIAHEWSFNHYAKKHDIDPITLMSLARQESGLDEKARSPVGARGIMQIMPATARYVARKYKLAYNGASDLYHVEKNIKIGSQYLDGLLDRYDNNRILAFAAYNAGPNRVKTWRKRSDGKLDVYAFIESIPFNETRGYVQNILMFETYYRNIMDIEGDFLNEHELRAKY